MAVRAKSVLKRKVVQDFQDQDAPLVLLTPVEN
jgi:hypothetical protein